MSTYRRLLPVALCLATVLSSGSVIVAEEEGNAAVVDASAAAAAEKAECTSTTEHGECLNPDATTTTAAAAAAAAAETKETDKSDDLISSSRRPVVTKEELARHNGRDGADIWLSVLGEVYDVTAGAEYYGPGKGYGAFAGTDCSVCYVSGVFNEEEASKPLEEIADKMIGGIVDWKKFYDEHDVYKHVGRLIDDRFFDDTGSPTPSMQTFAKRVVIYQIEAAEKKKKRDIERKKRDAERKAKKKETGKMNILPKAKVKSIL